MEANELIKRNASILFSEVTMHIYSIVVVLAICMYVWRILLMGVPPLTRPSVAKRVEDEFNSEKCEEMTLGKWLF